MSNESSSVNRPRHRVSKSSAPPSGRSRKFSCITYLEEIKLKMVLCAHSQQIRYYAYAYHDMDKKEDGSLKEKHCHIVLVTYSAHSLSAVRRWFSGFVDSKGMDITTTAQMCSDVYSMYDYLDHNTKECIEQGKYIYDKSIIKTNDKDGYFKAQPGSDYDTVTLAAEMLLKGHSVRELGQIFGRDFILHYRAIKDYCYDVLRNESKGMDFEAVFERDMQIEIAELNRW